MLTSLKFNLFRRSRENAELEITCKAITGLTVIIVLGLREIVEHFVVSIERQHSTHALDKSVT